MVQQRPQLAPIFRGDQLGELGDQGGLPTGKARLDLEEEIGFRVTRRESTSGRGHSTNKARVSRANFRQQSNEGCGVL